MASWVRLNHWKKADREVVRMREGERKKGGKTSRVRSAKRGREPAD